jgi:membrane dipeptidase
MKSYKQKIVDLTRLKDTMLDIERMKQGAYMAQVFAIFMPPLDGIEARFKGEGFSDEAYIEHCFKAFKTTMELSAPLVAEGASAAAIEANEKAGKMSAFLSFEDGRPIAGRLENLDRYYRKGIRLITLTWNGENCFGFPNSQNAGIMNAPLKPFGRDAVLRMNEIGMIVDVSHLSDGGFWDVAELSKKSKKPFVASHSNCRALSPHPRNLTDDMIRALAEAGGVAGLNFNPGFVNPDTESNLSTAAGISAHAKHLINTGGSECAALGGDLDGIEGNIEIDGAEKLPLLLDQFKKDGMSWDQIEKIAWKNALRVIKALSVTLALLFDWVWRLAPPK